MQKLAASVAAKYYLSVARSHGLGMRIRKRASAFGWLAVAALLIGAGALLLWQRQGPSRAGLSSARALSAIAHAPATLASDRSPPTGSGQPPNTTPTSKAAAHTIEICGSGAVPIPSDDPTEINRYLSARVEPAAQRWETTMLSSDSYRARAVGTYIQAIGNGNRAEISEQGRNELAQIALEGTDPAVFAIASRACDTDLGKAAPGDCQKLTLQRWTQLDSDNAEPWLLLAADAHSKGALDTESDAVEHAAAAHSFNNYGDSLYAFSAPSLPNDATPFERAWLAAQLIGFVAAWPRPEYGYLRTHCPSTALQDDRVRRQCEALANLLLNKSNTILDLSMSRVMGQQLGWPQPRLDRMKEETNALMMTSWEDLGTPSWTCRRVDHYNEYFDQLSRMSELAVARQAAARTGVSIPDLARQYTEMIERLTHN